MNANRMRRAAARLIIIASLLGAAKAVRILGLFPIPAKSHFSCNEAIMKSLHAAGHHITMVSPFPSETQFENFTYIDSRFDNFIYVGQSTMEDLYDQSLGYIMNLIKREELKYCYDVMKLPEIQELLNSTKKLYDVVFIELLMAYECYLPIAEKLGIPVIGTVTFRSWKVADDVLGVPNNPAVIPLELAASKPEMGFVDRIKNLWNYFITDYYMMKTRNEVENFYQEYYAEDLLHKKQISLIFFNNHASLLPRATIPNAIEIGGIHAQPANPLPEDLKTFIDEASHGVILFTLGSVIRASSLPLEKRQAFLDAFASIPQKVIWKFEEPIENLPKNVMISSWLPQRDILEHKNVIAFMSHCGQSGVYEAVITGTPVVTIPLFADQQANAAILHHRAVGVDLDLKKVTKETVLAALHTIINDTSYYQRMQELSHVFKDRPMTPQESIVYWTEYVVRHNGTPYLKALGTDMPIYKYLMLDIVVLALLITSAMIFVISSIARKVYVFVVRKSKYAISVKKSE